MTCILISQLYNAQETNTLVLNKDIQKCGRSIIHRVVPEYESMYVEEVYDIIQQNKFAVNCLHVLLKFLKKDKTTLRYFVYWIIGSVTHTQKSVQWSQKGNSDFICWHELAQLELDTSNDFTLHFHKDWRRFYKCLSQSMGIKDVSTQLEPSTIHIKKACRKCKFMCNDDHIEVSWACIILLIGKEYIKTAMRYSCGKHASIVNNWANASYDYLKNILKYTPCDDEHERICAFIKFSQECYEENEAIITKLRLESEEKERIKNDKVSKRKKKVALQRHVQLYRTSLTSAPKVFVDTCITRKIPFVIENPRNHLRFIII